MAETLTLASSPYAWPWHGAFVPSRTALLVVRDGNSSPPDGKVAETLTRVLRLSALAGITIAGLPGAGLQAGWLDSPVAFTVSRPHLGGFSGTDLDFTLRRRGISDLILAGFPFELGADCTMRQANDLGYECLALSDCCTGLAADTLAGALASIQMSGGIFGAVAPATALFELLARPFPAAKAAAHGVHP